MVREKAKSRLVTAGGIVVIIAACISVVNGLVALADSIRWLSYYLPIFEAKPFESKPFLSFFAAAALTYYETLLVVGCFALIGSAFGLAAGIQSLRRKQFAFTIVGVAFLMLAGFLNFLTISVPYGEVRFWPIVSGIPIFVLSLVGLVLVTTKRQEFT